MYQWFWIADNSFMGPNNSACKSGLAVKSGVDKSGKINIIKACKILGPRHHSC